MSVVYFITHPEVQISAAVPVTEWELSGVGKRRMHYALKQPWMQTLESIYSSTEVKAVEGAEILSVHLGLPFEQIKELGENDRSSTGYLPSSDFEKVADEFFLNPTESVRGWETALQAQERVVLALNTILRKCKTKGTVGIVSHGAVGALLLCKLGGWEISREYDQPGSGGGNYFLFDAESWSVIHSWKPVDEISA